MIKKFKKFLTEAADWWDYTDINTNAKKSEYKGIDSNTAEEINKIVIKWWNTFDSDDTGEEDDIYVNPDDKYSMAWIGDQEIEGKLIKYPIDTRGEEIPDAMYALNKKLVRLLGLFKAYLYEGDLYIRRFTEKETRQFNLNNAKNKAKGFNL